MKKKELSVIGKPLRKIDATFGQREHGTTAPHDGVANARENAIVGRYYLRCAERRIRGNLAALWDNDDHLTTETADLMLP
jgi:hypothetical protein